MSMSVAESRYMHFSSRIKAVPQRPFKNKVQSTMKEKRVTYGHVKSLYALVRVCNSGEVHKIPL